MYKNIEYAQERDSMKETYNNDTMCTAKFFSSTIYLQTGQTHSCYHPLPHDIPLEELKGNPSALHNTKHKNNARKEMLTGIQTAECNYCWRVEEMGDEHLSDRIIKSKNELLLTPDAHEQIIKHGWNHNYRPTYLEISFGNECNMKCAYCHPKASSAWMKEMNDLGPFETAPHLQATHEKIYEENDNPYVQAFWDWWPYLRKTLKVFRLTGGEPLLQQNFWKFLDMLENTDECHDMMFQVNTNLNVKNILVQRLVTKVDYLIKHKKIKKFAIYSSVESWGSKAEYARSGLDCDLFEKNVKTIMNGLSHYSTEDFSGITIMNTFNILCVTSYIEFLKKIVEWRKELHAGMKSPKIMFDIPHCTEPNHWTLIGLPFEYNEYFELIGEFFYKNGWKQNWKKYPKEEHDTKYGLYFSEEELKSWNRVISMWGNICTDRAKVRAPDYLLPRAIDDARRNFILFIKETDKRRGTNFKKTFPEMISYYELCESLEDINNMGYNTECKDVLMRESDSPVEYHLDDDFVVHHPLLANNILSWRKVRNLPTVVFNNDVLPVEKFGNFGIDDVIEEW
tara:strand:- start:9634 stop:11331 length:1698 start_codon:yes stop_codon:yes gene_type:complete